MLVKIAQCLLKINIQWLLCTVIKFHDVKETKEAGPYFVQDFADDNHTARYRSFDS